MQTLPASTAPTQRRPARFVWGTALCAALVVGWLLWQAPAARALDLADSRVLSGGLGADADGVWLGDSAQIALPAFPAARQRVLAWRWHAAPGGPLTVTTTAGTTPMTLAALPEWRRVQLLVPAAASAPTLSYRSETRSVAGDSRLLSVILSDAHFASTGDVRPANVVRALEFFALLAVCAWWASRAGWLGWAAYGIGALLLVVSLAQSVATGDAHTTLWLDRPTRLVLVGVLALLALRRKAPTPVAAVHTGRRFGLDVLRACAVLFVIVAHFRPLLFPAWVTDPDSSRIPLHFGALGVDIFFALSGYLIGGIMLRNTSAFAAIPHVVRFWQRRWTRTLPAAYVSAVVIWLCAPPAVLGDFLRSVLFVGSIDPAAVSTELTFWWSLATEELFYLLFPLVLWYTVRRDRSSAAFQRALIGFGVLTVVGRCVAMAVVPAAQWENLQINSVARLDSMIWGMLIQSIRVAAPARYQALQRNGLIAGVFLCALGYLMLVDQSRWYLAAMLAANTLMPLGAALTIPALAQLESTGSRTLDRLVSHLALVSFSAYLYHQLFQQLLSRWYGPAQSWYELGALAVVYLAATWGTATLSYRVIEAPILRWRDRVLPEHTGTASDR